VVTSAWNHDELRAVVLAMRNLQAPVRRDINKASRVDLNPIWKSEIASRARGPMDAKVLGTGARVKAGNPPTVIAASSRRAIGRSRRLKPTQSWYAWEFGANTGKVTTYRRRSKNGGTHQVTRHTARQLPARVKSGRVIYPAFAATAPRMAARWVSGVVRLVHLAAEGKSDG